MKNLLILLLLSLPLGMAGQTIDQGTVTYEQIIKVRFDRSRVPEGMGDMSKMIPKELRYQKLLTFSSTQSLFVAKPQEEPAEEQHGPGARMRVMMEHADDQTYSDLKKGRTIEQKEFFGRTFLIESDIEKVDWKITGEQKQIMGFNCMKATAMKDTVPIEAWFNPLIPISAGPETMAGQLPGLVMELSLDGGRVTYSAILLQAREVRKSEFAEPKKGKKVTREEYREIVAAKMKEMREQWGGGGPGRHMMIMH